MYIKEIKTAWEDIKRLPQSANEMLVVLSAANLLSAGVKLGLIKKHIGYKQFKPTITSLVCHYLRHPELTLLDELYYDKQNDCAYLRCLGLQFSFHSINQTPELKAFADSEDNREVGFDAVYKQPKALGLYKLANECMQRKLADADYIKKRYDALDWDFPELLTRHIGSENDGGDDVSITNILSAKFKVKPSK